MKKEKQKTYAISFEASMVLGEIMLSMTRSLKNDVSRKRILNELVLLTKEDKKLYNRVLERLEKSL